MTVRWTALVALAAVAEGYAAVAKAQVPFAGAVNAPVTFAGSADAPQHAARAAKNMYAAPVTFERSATPLTLNTHATVDAPVTFGNVQRARVSQVDAPVALAGSVDAPVTFAAAAVEAPVTLAKTVKEPVTFAKHAVLARASAQSAVTFAAEDVGVPADSPSERGIDEDDAHEPGTFDYLQHGADWKGTCSTGKAQSPIALEAWTAYSLSANTTSAVCGMVERELSMDVTISPIKMKVSSPVFPEKVWLNVESHDGSKAYRRKLRLVQFHFHSPAEHTLNGERYEGELHFVFEDMSTQQIEVVLGVLLKNTGNSNSLIQQLIEAPGAAAAADIIEQIKAGEDVKASYQADLKFDAKGLLHTAGITSTSVEAVTYAGSLTTPECNEGLTWILIPGEMDQTQADWLSLLHHANAAGNYRTVQPLNSRRVALTKVSDDPNGVTHVLLASAAIALISFLV